MGLTQFPSYLYSTVCKVSSSLNLSMQIYKIQNIKLEMAIDCRVSIHNFSPGALTVCNLHVTYSDINVLKNIKLDLH